MLKIKILPAAPVLPGLALVEISPESFTKVAVIKTAPAFWAPVVLDEITPVLMTLSAAPAGPLR